MPSLLLASLLHVASLSFLLPCQDDLSDMELGFLRDVAAGISCRENQGHAEDMAFVVEAAHGLLQRDKTVRKSEMDFVVEMAKRFLFPTAVSAKTTAAKVATGSGDFKFVDANGL